MPSEVILQIMTEEHLDQTENLKFTVVCCYNFKHWNFELNYFSHQGTVYNQI